MTRRAPGPDRFDDVPLAALLRSAQEAYAHATHRALIQAGYEDLPRAGRYIVGAMNWSNASLESVIRWMGVSKQAVGQSVDSLVLRGYLARVPDGHDRRKVNLVLTKRGKAAGDVVRTAIQQVDARLRSRLGPRQIAQTRATLASLTVMGFDTRSGGARAPRDA